MVESKKNSLLSISRVLLVEDNPGDADLVIEYLSRIEHCQFDCTAVTSLKNAIELMRSFSFDIVLFDLYLPDSSGIEGLERLSVEAKNIPIVVLTGSEDEALGIHAISSGAQDYLSKRELNSRELFRSIRFAIERSQHLQKLQSLSSSRYEAQQEAFEADVERKSANEANAAKSSFLANMSHEIRTPLGVILGYADLALQKGSSDSERAGFVEGIQRNAIHLGKIVDDILDLAKVEAGKFEPEISEINFKSFLGELIRSFSFKAQEKGLSLTVKVPGTLPEVICCDRTRMTQILTNLLGNAIKFTVSGEVAISVSLSRPTESGNQSIIYRILDSGIGLTVVEAERLFKPFSQADNSMTRRYGGTGLGLVLARTLARSLGGDLVLEYTEAGKGTCFSCSMPFILPEAVPILSKQINLKAEIDLSDLHILLVDDSIDNQVIIRKYLEQAGAKVDCKNDGSQGMEAAVKGNYDVVLMDIQMPVMEGNTATRSLRAEGYSRPIIALTAHAMSEERNLSASVGFSDYLTKPVDVSNLLSTVRKHGDFSLSNSIRPK